MRKLHFILFLLLANAVQSQDWTTCVVDSTITVELPSDYEIVEKDQKVLYSGLLPDASAALIKISPIPGDSALRSRDNLRKSYDNYKLEAIRTMGGVLQSEEIVNDQQYEMLRFIAKVKSNGVDQNVHFLLLNMKTVMYVLRFSEIEESAKKLTESREKFFRSLKIDEKAGDQISNTPDPKDDLGYRIGYIIGENLIWVLLVTLFLIVSIRSFRKSKNTMT